MYYMGATPRPAGTFGTFVFRVRVPGVRNAVHRSYLHNQICKCVEHAGVFNEVIVTNTIPVPDDRCFPQLTVLSVANLLGENIWKIYNQTPGER